MPTASADAAPRTPFVRRWQDRVTLIEYEGKPVVVAREFGSMLDYGAAGQGLADLVAGKWADEFIEEVDCIVLKNGRLAEFKRVCSSLRLRLVDKRAPSLLLLTESGIQLVLARTEKPEGKTFRRWLVSEVIPAYKASRALPTDGGAPRAPLPGPKDAPAEPRSKAPRLLAGPRPSAPPAVAMADGMDQLLRVTVLGMTVTVIEDIERLDVKDAAAFATILTGALRVPKERWPELAAELVERARR